MPGRPPRIEIPLEIEAEMTPAVKAFVVSLVDLIKAIGRDPALIRETFEITEHQARDRIADLKAERSVLRAGLSDDHARPVEFATSGRGESLLVEVLDRIRHADRRVTEIEDEMLALAAWRTFRV